MTHQLRKQTLELHPQYSQFTKPEFQTQKPHNPNFVSPIISYFNSSHVYLHRKYSENSQLNFQSNNFLKKSICHDETKGSVEEEEEEGEEKEDEEEESQEESKESEYSQLNPTGAYNNQSYNTNINLNGQIMTNQMTQINGNMINMNPQPGIQGNSMSTIQKQRSRYDSAIFGFGSNGILVNNNTSSAQTEMFGRKGWVCQICGNFNYDTRNRCNRCQQGNKAKKTSNNNITKSNGSNSNSTTTSQSKFSERAGDWTCLHCQNLNFAFRTQCNRCHLPKEKSESLIFQSNGLAYSRINNF